MVGNQLQPGASRPGRASRPNGPEQRCEVHRIYRFAPSETPRKYALRCAYRAPWRSGCRRYTQHISRAGNDPRAEGKKRGEQMKRLIAGGFLALAVCAGASAADSSTDIHIPFEKYKLKNGLRVVLSRDNSVPVIAVYMLYDVGARSEEKGRTGFAHLFEHMMFEGSANIKKGDQSRYVEG